MFKICFLVFLKKICAAYDEMASKYQPPTDYYDSYDRLRPSRGNQSRSFKMLQQLTAEEEAFMEDL